MTDRALRADAQRNVDRIVAAASEVFAGSGAAAASIDDIVQRAGVGSATFYRRFPTRDSLFNAVYADQVDHLLAEDDSASNDSREQLERWLRRFLDFILGKRAFAEEMAHDTDLVLDARRRIYAAAGPLLERAQRDGLVRSDISADDVLRMLSGVGLADYPTPGQRKRVLEICFRGLRPNSSDGPT